MSDVSKLKINNVTYNIKDSLALRDAPSDGEEYVRKNGAWAISSGGSEGSGGSSGGVNAMYYYEQTVNTATDAEIMRITDSRINTNSIVLECTFANPEYITSDVAWTSYAGYIAFTGTCTTATTANVTIGYTSNENFSDRLMTLLWENPNPTSDFSSQTLSLDFSSYDFILVKTKLQKSNQEYQDYKDTFIIEKNNNFTMVMHLGAQANSLSANKYTKARIVNFTDDSITIGDCYSRQWNTTSGNSGTVTNSDCIPLAIYGISRYNYFEEKEAITVTTGISGVTANTYGEVKMLFIYKVHLSGSAGVWNSVGTLPDALKPKDVVHFLLLDNGATSFNNSKIIPARITTSGTLEIWAFSDKTSAYCDGTVSYV